MIMIINNNIYYKQFFYKTRNQLYKPQKMHNNS